jgi:hypothetical protein
LFAGLAFTGTTAVAQDQKSQVTPPPSVLVIDTEYLKPGQAGSPHHKSEAAFVQTSRNANWPEHYLATTALTGNPRAVFFFAYDSFADWQKDIDATAANSSFSAAIDSELIADGALLAGQRTSAYVYNADLSLNADGFIAKDRYFDITLFHVRPGHEKDWNTVVKLYRDAFAKLPGAHWAVYDKEYGDDSGSVVLFITPIKSLAEVDQNLINDKKLDGLVSAEQMQKMSDLVAASVESNESYLFAFDPAMSYAPDSWIQADPGFWNKK